MCGIAGVLSTIAPSTDELGRMGCAMRHRGPDDEATWCDVTCGIGLAHARLSILDLSTAGRQPMVSRTGRYVIVFNGEIYNHLSLRADAEMGPADVAWRGHSDTETLLAAFERWGVPATLRRAEGMFAFGLWDRHERELTLARDRLGEKPLYYGWQGNTFLFGSELKSLTKHPAFHAPIDRGALALLLQYGYIPSPHTIYEGLRKLHAGATLTVSLRSRAEKLDRYWDFRAVVAAGRAEPFLGTAHEAADELERELTRAIRQQMIADVPLGAFLSGGIDSSTVVALMQQSSSRPVRTFTIGFDTKEYDEAASASAVASHLGTDHTVLHVSSRDALDVVPRIPELFSEPFADSSQIPAYLVSALARSKVTVALSGDGGDELFAGYNRYTVTHRWWKNLARVPRQGRRAMSQLMTSVSPQTWDRWAGPVQSLLVPASDAQAHIGDKIHKAASAISARDETELYHHLISHWMHPLDVVIGGSPRPSILSNASEQPLAGNAIEQMMALDTLTYLQDDILVKVDRASMGASLESRVPMLDHRVIEFAWRLPLQYKLRDGVSKWPLRQILYSRVPRELFERPKKGFAVPLDTWLRGPLRPWAEDLLSEDRLRREGFFRPNPIRKRWNELMTGARSWQHHIWDVLMFQSWLAAQSA